LITLALFPAVLLQTDIPCEHTQCNSRSQHRDLFLNSNLVALCRGAAYVPARRLSRPEAITSSLQLRSCATVQSQLLPCRGCTTCRLLLRQHGLAGGMPYKIATRTWRLSILLEPLCELRGSHSERGPLVAGCGPAARAMRSEQSRARFRHQPDRHRARLRVWTLGGNRRKHSDADGGKDLRDGQQFQPGSDG
jgi:hypothetical protein